MGSTTHDQEMHPDDVPSSEKNAIENVDPIAGEGTEDHEVDDIPANGQTRGISILVAIALLTFAGVGLHFIRDVFTPIFLALTLVLALRPIGQWMTRKGLPSWLGSTVTIILLFLTIGGIVGVTVWSLTPVPQTLINYSANFEATVNAVLQWLQEKDIQTDDLSTYLDQINFNSIVSWAWGLVDSLSSFGGILTIIVVSAFFLTIDTTVTTARSRIVNVSHRSLGQALHGFERRVRHYWIVSTFFGLVVALIDAVVLQMMGIPLAWTWGYWAFVTNYIPNIGFIIGVIPPMLMALLDQGWQAMVWVLVLYSVINVVIQTFIQPKFTGDVVGLSPTVTFISLVLWTTIVGILGSILAVPLTLFFKALLVDSDPRTRWLDAFLVSEWESERRRQDGRYDVEHPAEEHLGEFHYPFVPSADRVKPRAVQRPKLSGLTRQLKRATKKKK